MPSSPLPLFHTFSIETPLKIACYCISSHSLNLFPPQHTQNDNYSEGLEFVREHAHEPILTDASHVAIMSHNFSNVDK